ncbi:unnamed protein product [Tuber melanosporum]|uniref:(Perigord truffle) hypothetical protein n=1 Tax=Tuber melanosporum (strain Mel28) TaxID=656061 RepID=D5GEJ8_TUBMM|nr:uncharacterized protein GSTUM_00006526001 [Tuber melanosporum]CAZ82941.1 unnamed protein product [Tuber melanosporum]
MASSLAFPNGHGVIGLSPRARFSDIPRSIDIPVSAGDEDEDDENAVVEVDPDALPEDPTELCTLLENERSPKQYWMYIALAYAKHDKVDIAIEIITKGLQAKTHEPMAERLPMLHLLTWLYLERSREAAKNVAEGSALISEAKTKDHYLQLATQILNESSRLDPASTLVTLARGVYSVFKASVGTVDKNTHMDNAAKIFDDAVRTSRATNMLAIMGRARVLYGKGRYERALESYQEVLTKRPDMDPDPRIGIGLCCWHLGHKDDALVAWERALELDPNSKYAHILKALYHLHVTSNLSEYDPEFINNYRLVIEHTQKAFKLDKQFPLACTTFASHFFIKKGYSQCELLAKKAIEYSDVAAVTADGWFSLARKAHVEGEYEKALGHYKRSDALREGYLPVKLGIGQVQILMKDLGAAKYTFEAIVQVNPKCIEARSILGTLYADEVLSAIPRTGFSASKEDVTVLHRKAISLLENVRFTWKAEAKKNDAHHETILLSLARLYENDQPERALQCLLQVEEIYKYLIDNGDDVMIPLQLTNNIATLYWQKGEYNTARTYYQNALNAIPELKEKDDAADTDALATTLTYNLARCEEAAGNIEEAVKNYEKLLAYHDDYVDANMRLAYLALRRGAEDGHRRIQKLMQTDGNNLEVRALYGWYLGRQKRKHPIVISDDPEQRHYKHTLQNHEKHDRYSLIGMGNIYLLAARDIKKENEQEREKRRKLYEKAVEFFDKALQLDPKNAYAAQGIAIASVEDRKDLKTAISMFSKVKETLSKDAHSLVNFGHCLAGLDQWARAIENYESALTKFQLAKDPTTLTCLGKAYFSKGRKERTTEPEKSMESFKNALDYAKRALAIAPDNVMYMFNVAYVQFQIVQFIMSLPETSRSLEDLEAASKGLEEGIQSFSDIARSNNPPYPSSEIEARSTMGKNTFRKQMERAIQKQREYEEKNQAKLAEARRKREEDLRRKREAKEAEEREIEKRNKAIADQRKKMQEEAREFAERKAEEERIREENSDGEKKRKRSSAAGSKSRSTRKRGSKKDGTIDSDSTSEPSRRRSKSKSAITDDDEQKPARKRKKLTRRASPTNKGKFKSSEVVNPSDDEDDDDDIPAPPLVPLPEASEEGGKKRKRKPARAIDSGDDEDLEDVNEDLFGDDPSKTIGGSKDGEDVEMRDRAPTPGVDDED